MNTQTTRQVRSVYSGKANKCMCGCAGKHSYASQFVAEATADRGYEVTQDEVNDRFVARVSKMMEMQNGMFPVEFNNNEFMACEVGARSYVVYFAN